MGLEKSLFGDVIDGDSSQRGPTQNDVYVLGEDSPWDYKSGVKATGGNPMDVDNLRPGNYWLGILSNETDIINVSGNPVPRDLIADAFRKIPQGRHAGNHWIVRYAGSDDVATGSLIKEDNEDDS